jgi:hypothetical protein
MQIPSILRKRGIEDILSLDFETYYADDYTLSSNTKGFHTTTEYVRSPKFKAHGCVVQRAAERSSTWVTAKDLRRFFRSVKWKKTAILAHHTQFDGFILTQRFGCIPAFYFDTLSMARAALRLDKGSSLDTVGAHYGLGGKTEGLESTKNVRNLTPAQEKVLAKYAKNDMRLLRGIFDELIIDYPDDELMLIHLTCRAYCEPKFVVDKRLARKIVREETQKRKSILTELNVEVEQLRSRPKFAELLRELGVEPPMKISPRTGEETFAFAEKDLAFQELMTHPSERVRLLCDAKLNASSNIKTSRAQRLLAHADPALPIYLKYGAAHTLRWSGGDNMNPQNFPRKSELRACIRAPKGYKLVIVDSGQIEARMVMWLAEQEDVLKAFREGRDVYREFAAELFNKEEKDITSDERFVGKVCILGLNYMLSFMKLQYTLESGSMGTKVVLPPAMYKKCVKTYRDRMDKIVELWRTMKTLIDVLGGNAKPRLFKESWFEPGRVILPNGMPLLYPEMELKGTKMHDDMPEQQNWTYRGGRKIYNGLFTENMTQALARLVVAEQILRVTDQYDLGLMVHDEGVFIVPTSKAKQALTHILEAFHTPSEWCKDLPTTGEGCISSFYTKP